MSAGEALGAAVAAALQGLEGVGVYDGPPVQAAFPYATIETGAESDWGHKSGVGREVRVVAVLRDQGERPARLRRLAGEAEALIAGIAGALDGWQLVSLTLLRSCIVKDARSWAATVEYRARMLAG